MAQYYFSKSQIKQATDLADSSGIAAAERYFDVLINREKLPNKEEIIASKNQILAGILKAKLEKQRISQLSRLSRYFSHREIEESFAIMQLNGIEEAQGFLHSCYSKQRLLQLPLTVHEAEKAIAKEIYIIVQAIATFFSLN